MFRSESEHAESEHTANKRAEKKAKWEAEKNIQEEKEAQQLVKKEEEIQQAKENAQEKKRKRKEEAAQQAQIYFWQKAEYLSPLITIAAGVSLYRIGCALLSLVCLTASIFVLSYAVIKLIQAGINFCNRLNKIFEKIEEFIEDKNIETAELLHEADKMLHNINGHIDETVLNVNGQLNDTVRNLNGQLNDTVRNVNAQIEPTATELKKTISEVGSTFHHVNDGAETVRRLAAPLTLPVNYISRGFQTALEMVNDVKQESKHSPDDYEIPASRGFFTYYLTFPLRIFEEAMAGSSEPSPEVFLSDEDDFSEKLSL